VLDDRGRLVAREGSKVRGTCPTLEEGVRFIDHSPVDLPESAAMSVASRVTLAR
jgi:hypothetical protein